RGLRHRGGGIARDSANIAGRAVPAGGLHAADPRRGRGVPDHASGEPGEVAERLGGRHEPVVRAGGTAAMMKTPRQIAMCSGRACRGCARRAFTLVELLVAVGAVALIAVGLAAGFGSVGDTVTGG